MRKVRLVFEIEVSSIKKLPTSIHIPVSVRRQLENGERKVTVEIKRKSQVRFAYGDPIAALSKFAAGKTFKV